MTTEELEQIRTIIREENAPLNKRLDGLKQGQDRIEKTQQEHGAAIKQQGSVINHIATAIKALATKQDVERVEKEVDKLKQRLRPHRAD